MPSMLKSFFASRVSLYLVLVWLMHHHRLNLEQLLLNNRCCRKIDKMVPFW